MSGPGIDEAVSAVAAAIGESKRAQILMSLLDGRARTGTELVALTELSPSTVSAHLQRLEAAHLVTMRRQGRHRYYSLSGAEVAALLERLSVLAGDERTAPLSKAPQHLREARTCYDHIAGTIGVALHDRLAALGWLTISPSDKEETYELTSWGVSSLSLLGINVEAARGLRRRFAFGCLDWTERRCHLGGALGAVLLQFVHREKWFWQDLNSRALRVTDLGRRELLRRFGLVCP